MMKYIRIFFVATALCVAFVAGGGLNASPRIEQADSKLPQVKIIGSQLELTAPDGETVKFEIYSITGQLVKTIELRGQSERLDLPQGCYIVRAPGCTKKIVLK